MKVNYGHAILFRLHQKSKKQSQQLFLVVGSFNFTVANLN